MRHRSYSASAKRARSRRQRLALEAVTEAAFWARATRYNADETIRRARRLGVPLRAIAYAAGCSHEKVRRIESRG